MAMVRAIILLKFPSISTSEQFYKEFSLAITDLMRSGNADVWDVLNGYLGKKELSLVETPGEVTTVVHSPGGKRVFKASVVHGGMPISTEPASTPYVDAAPPKEEIPDPVVESKNESEERVESSLLPSYVGKEGDEDMLREFKEINDKLDAINKRLDYQDKIITANIAITVMVVADKRFPAMMDIPINNPELWAMIEGLSIKFKERLPK